LQEVLGSEKLQPHTKQGVSMTEPTHGLSGGAGEYYVCAELSTRGFIAALTLKNTEGVDILASRPNSGRAVTIQVKTIQGANRKWVMNMKHEKIVQSDLFYVFVRLGDVGRRPDSHVVPSSEIAAYVARNHREWLSGTKKNGAARKDTPMRSFSDLENDYLERWELLQGSFSNATPATPSNLL
jgi:hypothetical protein